MTKQEKEAVSRQMDEQCDALEAATRRALQAMDRMETEPDWQESCLHRLCEKLADCKAWVFAWANDHGEP